MLLLLTQLVTVADAQPYQPNWESLDKRPVPQWFTDAKFGIFIHWGVYSVPGYCTKGNYAEWYQNGLMNGDSARIKFHKQKFGNRSYYDLANDFKAELYNPDEWAKLFEKSGAKYIVLTSKHHDGFTLWPDKTADKTWGFSWNAGSIGPKRDLLGDLFTAVRKTSVHPGMYYSLYEWFNPLWKKDPKQFAVNHTWPQMKELITKYEPDVFWTDGDWDAPASTWKSEEFLAWVYNESNVKDRIVTYDRWGSGVRFNHGGVYTPEYQPDLDFENHAWEESRGMGYSYGYNREEDAWDYNSTQSLVIALIDKVSRGGNFLLDIGPDEHGKIPPIMQERLLQIGDWLNVNGEAIYNTRRWKNPVQWSEGRRDYKGSNEHISGDWKTGGDIMLKLTVDPDPGYAVKEIFYTYNEKNNNLYAIFPKYPDDQKLVLKNMHLPANTTLSFLSTNERLLWKQAGDNAEITLPNYNPNKIKTPYAFAVKIENFGRFSQKPVINLSYKTSITKPSVDITAPAGTTVYYTLDGTTPSLQSTIYSKPFQLTTSAIFKAIAVPNDKSVMESNVTELYCKTYNWMRSLAVSKAKPGIAYKYYETSQAFDKEVEKLTAKSSGVVNAINLEKKERVDKFAFVFDGYIKISKEGVYTFYTSSDDGSLLYIDDELVVNNDGNHGNVEKQDKAALRKGFHKIKLVYYDNGGGNELKVSVQQDGGKKVLLSGEWLFH
ncbi:MAG: alpha-L-fucosidase [Sphingobacteriales bacterium]|nr:alpha-L-fucosidase [Sphingobacteriales bacterium]MBI3717708.1 alpha-L-fucosidase [Sphingobacteriales bacterium]